MTTCYITVKKEKKNIPNNVTSWCHFCLVMFSRKRSVWVAVCRQAGEEGGENCIIIDYLRNDIMSSHSVFLQEKE